MIFMSDFEEIEKKTLVKKSIAIPIEQNEKLRELAFFQKRPESEIIRDALNQYFKGKDFIKDLAERRKVIDELLKKT
jgi:predicted DNA-binding protein